MPAGLDGVAAPPEPPLGPAGAPAAEGDGDLGLEQPLRVPGQAVGRPSQEAVGRVGGVVHDSGLGKQRVAAIIADTAQGRKSNRWVGLESPDALQDRKLWVGGGIGRRGFR